MPSKTLTTGITGQDGSYLAEFLLKKGRKINIRSAQKIVFAAN